MYVYIILAEDGNLLHVGSTHIGTNSIEIEVPDDCEIFGNPELYVYNGTTIIKVEEI